MSTDLKPEILKLPSDQDASGRTLGAEEIQLLTEVIQSGTLTSTKGTFVSRLESRFAERLGVEHTHACSSGSAALHVAVAAIDPEPGDEIITTAITDMGALTCILFQGAIPVFCDVDPRTFNVTAESIAKCISEKTRAIMVTHLFGNPCEMGPIMELAKHHDLKVIEDCAQAFDASWQGRRVGTMGDISCFSLQQGKHITTGEGGLVCTNDPDLARRCFLFINKAWGYGDQCPDHYFLAPNYRMNELTGAVAFAQLGKLDQSVQSRKQAAQQMHGLLEGIAGVSVPTIHDGNEHTFWKYCLDIDPSVIDGGCVAMADLLRARGVFSAPRYIQKPAFRCQVFAEQRTFGNSRFPFTLARPEAVDYDDARFPGTLTALARILVLPWNERYTSEHVQYVASAVRECARGLKKA